MNFKHLLKPKQALLGIATFFSFFAAKAQQPTTAAAYPFAASSKTYNYLSGGTSITFYYGGYDDDYRDNIPIGFPFTFCGSTYTTVTAITNGWMQFGNTSSSYYYYPASQSYFTYTAPCVMAGWCDAMGGSGWQVSYLTTGSAPNRLFTLEFKNWTNWSGSPGTYISYQYRLYEDGGVELLYKQESGSAVGFASSAAIGIAKSTSDWQTLSSTGTAPTSSSTVFNNTTIQGTRPATGQSYYWGIQKKGFNNAAVNGLVSPVAPFCSGNQNFQVRLKNAGKNQINNVTVNWIVDGVVQTPVNYTTMIDTMGSVAGNFATVTLGNVNFANIPRTIKIYTSNPNGLADTVNGDDTMVITMRSSPLANITAAGPTVYCGGGVINTLLNATTGTGYTYRWKLNTANIVPAATGASYTATAAGDYTVQVDSGACSNTSPILRIDNLAMPQPTVTPATSANFCDNDSVQISANANISGATYQWRFNGADIPGETNASIYAKIAGNYNVITTKFSCKATSPGVNIQQVAPPSPLVNKNGNTLMTAANYVSYQWYINSTTPITGETNFYFIPQQSGDYSVEVSNGGCKRMSPIVRVEIDNTGINNTNSAKEINIFPNPATDVIHINAPMNVNASISSVDGKQLMNVQHAKDINIGNLPNGVYIIKLTTDDNYLIKLDKIRKVSN